MLLEEAKATLKGSENRANFAKGWAGADSVASLADLVERDPVAWMKTFPDGLKTYKNMSKPKTAFLEMLKLDAVRELLGAERADRLTALVTDAWKTNHAALLRSRTAATAAAVNDCDFDEAMASDDEAVEAADIDASSATPAMLDRLVALGTARNFSEAFFLKIAHLHADLEKTRAISNVLRLFK